MLDVVNQLVHGQAYSQRVDVLFVDWFVRRLLQHHVKDLHELLCLVLFHERLQFLDQGNLHLVFWHVKFKLVLKDFEHWQVVNFQEVLKEYFCYLERNVVSLQDYWVLKQGNDEFFPWVWAKVTNLVPLLFALHLVIVIILSLSSRTASRPCALSTICVGSYSNVELRQIFLLLGWLDQIIDEELMQVALDQKLHNIFMVELRLGVQQHLQEVGLESQILLLHRHFGGFYLSQERPSVVQEALNEVRDLQVLLLEDLHRLFVWIGSWLFCLH